MALFNEADVYRWIPQARGNESLLSEAVTQAQSISEEYCGRGLVSRSYDERRDIEPGQRRIVLSSAPVTEVAAVYEHAAQASPLLLASSQYVTDAEAGILTRTDGCWEAGDQSVRLLYTAGYTTETCPEALRRAMLQTAAWLLEFRGNVGVQREAVDGYTVVNEDMDGPLPRSIGTMLQAYRRLMFG